MPDANEWVHEFSWYGTDAGKVIQNKFTKLRTIPDQINYSTEVRTHDDVLLTLKLIVFYEMSDIERMLVWLQLACFSAHNSIGFNQ